MLLVIQKDELRCIEVDENLLVSSFADSWLFQRVYYAISYSSYICCRLITIGKIKFIFYKCWINSILHSFSRLCGFSFFLKSFHIQITFYTKIWSEFISWPFVFIINFHYPKFHATINYELETKSTREEILIKKWIINSYERSLFFPSSGDVYQGWKSFLIIS